MVNFITGKKLFSRLLGNFISTFQPPRGDIGYILNEGPLLGAAPQLCQCLKHTSHIHENIYDLTIHRPFMRDDGVSNI